MTIPLTALQSTFINISNTSNIKETLEKCDSMYEMFPQAELENYKLQVELLQEKLQRSEENRQQLEHKLDKILQKRSELDKSMRHKTRQKYQEFLEEQTKRNERNKMLVQMLERIDQQTAAMSQRSERLKMMKMQYQMYFAKLVQSQTMRCLQQTTTTPAAIPVLVPTATQATAVAAPTTATTTPIATNQTLAETSLNLTPRNLSAEPTVGQQQWTLAMATPTQAGMLLATPPRTAAGNEYLPYPIGYMPRMNATAGALGFEDLYVGGGGLGVGLGRNFYDMRPSLRAFDMQQQQQQGVDLRKSMYGDAMDNFDDALPTGVYQTIAGATGSREKSAQATPTVGTGELSSTSSTLATSSLTFDKLPKTRLSESVSMEPHQQNQQQQQRQWAEERQQQHHAANNKNDDIGKPQMEALTGRRTSSGSSNGINNNNNYYGDNAYNNNASINDDEKDNALPNSRVTKVEQEKSSSFALNNQRAQEPWTAAAAEAVEQYQQPAQQKQQQQQQQQQNIAANFAALKIDEPWQATTKTWQQTKQDELNMNMNKPEMNAAADATFEPRDENTVARMTHTTAAATATAAAVAAAAVTATTPATAMRSPALVDEQLNAMQGNQLPMSLSTLLPATSLNRANDALTTKPTMSIENIENAIYGELVNPTTTTAAANESTAVTANAESGHVGQGLFENLATAQEPQISEPQAGVTETAEPTTPVGGSVADTNAHKLDSNNASASADAVAADYATAYDEATSYVGEQSASSVSYEPTYATIDGNTAVTAAATTQEQNVEPIYSEIGNPTDYQRGYESLSADASGGGIQQDANVVGEAATAVATTNVGDNQEDYANIDYSNYDASQYGDAYDPNAYPGYIYDETTGQYIADPNAPQYATDENYTAQGYADGEAANYDYSAAYAQQEQEQAQSSNVAAMATNVDLYGESEVTAEAATMPSGDETEVANTEAEISPTTMMPAVNEAPATENVADATAAVTPLAAGKIVKPTSILSSADKQAAANDAQQKKKKRVNFVDSSETDESSSAKPAQGGTTAGAATAAAAAGGGGAGAGSESDFDFSVSSEAQN